MPDFVALQVSRGVIHVPSLKHSQTMCYKYVGYLSLLTRCCYFDSLVATQCTSLSQGVEMARRCARPLQDTWLPSNAHLLLGGASRHQQPLLVRNPPGHYLASGRFFGRLAGRWVGSNGMGWAKCKITI